jgi:hypothetical protein
MRTTISLDDDAFAMVKQYAETRSLGLGKAVSELVRRGASHRYATREVNGLKIFDLPADSPKVSARRVKELESES